MKYFKQLYYAILRSCNSKVAPYILAMVSFTESCCFIIPPEVMMLPMSYASRKKSFHYALIATVSSILGALAGYYLGYFFWEAIKPYAFEYIAGFEANFDYVGDLYHENAVTALFIAAFTPIPFKVFTVLAGVYHEQVSLIVLLTMSLIGRGSRYYILCGLVYFLGPKAKELIEKHFKMFTIIVGVAAVLLAVLYKLLT